MAVWTGYRAGRISEEDICALLFNAMGMLHEILKSNGNHDHSRKKNYFIG